MAPISHLDDFIRLDNTMSAVDTQLKAAYDHVVMQVPRADILAAYEREGADGLADLAFSLGFPAADPVVILGLGAVAHPRIARELLAAANAVATWGAAPHETPAGGAAPPANDSVAR
jgi:hypothetical protein